jgi:hypothetical protein
VRSQQARHIVVDRGPSLLRHGMRSIRAAP